MKVREETQVPYRALGRRCGPVAAARRGMGVAALRLVATVATVALWASCMGAGAAPPPDLVAAAARGDAATVDALLAAGADPNLRQAGGRTALMAAAALGRYTIVRALLVHGAERDAKDDAGRTAFDHAVMKGQADVIALLRDAS